MLRAAAVIAAMIVPGVAAAELVIGSKVFTESVILSEIAVQLARDSGEGAKHRRELGGTRVLWSALERGDIDCYPEYSGTLRAEIFAQTGLQFMQFNTLFQLLAAQQQTPGLLESADCLLLTPDFIHWALCGARVVEFTNGSTTYRYRVNDSVTYNANVAYRIRSQYKLLDDLTIRVGVVNLLNAQPPLSSDSRGYDPAVYNLMARGRAWSGQLTKKF